MTMSPEARAQVEAFEKDRASGAAAYRVATSRFGARTLGSVALATVGTTVWTDPEQRRSAHDDNPMGGIVLDIVDLGRHDNPDTGEITVKRAFRCYDYLAPWQHAFHTFADDQINPDGVEATEPKQLALAVRRFCLRIAQGKGMLTSHDGQLIADAHHLAAALLGGVL